MKNSFKFAFLGLALTVAFASCNGTANKSETTSDSLAIDSANTVIDSANTAIDSAKTVVDSAKVAIDSAKAAH
ncbi:MULTISPECIES: hypothetical protein [Sphingobacterium]|jgi:hypothetical protein|uniref:hypothetical protein n=1 Tax=Sphingobacterium TaxID=28453 RepID=UPI00097E7DA2|nr:MULTISPECIES: hypothetical protein [Sphingobacterium]UZJ66292.1 hypothetical protein OKW96_09675 [Sphingobacterium sp. KU25419]SJN17785.1 hypothetical protein FM120_00700 [Sphingobacterium faecium PCAi_F2.5]MQP28446.1 hypothetical protein [Sphingobacterium faecium]PTX11530.1 hypothetical protein C8N37_103103 [Sphingobacterium faecium]UPZ38523.1 hypothetical protein MUB18_09510 [Sphingobacterium sp. PCS056]